MSVKFCCCFFEVVNVVVFANVVKLVIIIAVVAKAVAETAFKALFYYSI